MRLSSLVRNIVEVTSENDRKMIRIFFYSFLSNVLYFIQFTNFHIEIVNRLEASSDDLFSQNGGFSAMVR